MDLYRSKAAIVRGLAPVVDGLAARGISPDAITLAAVPVSIVAGACTLLSSAQPGLLLAVPILAGGRLLLNLLDGALARSTGRIHPRGELYNEVGDRVADLAFLIPVAFVPGADPVLVLLGAIAALLASFVGITVRAAGGERVYRGILSKPGRMILVSVFAVIVFFVGPRAWGWFGPILAIGALLTVVERVVVGLQRLR